MTESDSVLQASYVVYCTDSLCVYETPVLKEAGAATQSGEYLQVRTASCSAANCVNTFGDEQLAVDLLADKLLFEALKYSVSCRPKVP